ncbi:MAG: DUF1992 domain-containing protein [Candidatus Syntrophonatronum acetioxidans]|uniref:DUF1992 domain-containing protein n=1 Tax=Candidatus Syntrophonatronum acetioxidans TaxID=1795816 RepID=A0A424YER3_9FIRM|nr:MAG: DUF1992 domain-containing protein [Candidatus Syntrophonatronum acetioxidans]
MDIIAIIAENKIQEAIREGEFDNLPGRGKPLRLEDLSHVPEDLRAAYTILKNNGILPEEIQLKKDIVTLQELIDCCYDEGDKERLKRKLNEKVLRFEMLMEKRRIKGSSLNQYIHKIYKKLGAF